ncbi:AGE family epimerase/isomerase [Brevundimonas sp. FT23042]|uniref:AGE family epimerase/isomerase n=1 Tax=Brevundimonas sp. FT23042 TaxID=3393749 RepID=UPI003B587248
MAIFPVILCGGAGTRLWPASRSDRPKQFLDLTSNLSLFQETLRRVAPLAGGGGQVVVVAGQEHRGVVVEQLGDIPAIVLLEPSGRDSAAAMAAAAHWIARQDPDGVAAFVASDHRITQDELFRSAVREASQLAREDRLVVFGVKPTEPSSAYGYIQPERAGGASPVLAFVEKPDRKTAINYLSRGYLWNSGNLVARAGTLLAELRAFAPEVEAAVAAATPRGGGAVQELTPAFETAPKISMDYAVLERSRKVWVLPVVFDWSDLGAWDAVAATDTGGRGLWIGGGGDTSNLVRAAEGMVVATAGVTDLAIIAEPDAVLVCHLSRSQEVKSLVERLREISPRHVSPEQRRTSLPEAAERFCDWMDLAALPLWATLGSAGDGAFVEALDAKGRAVGDFRRARVQARQAYVYSAAGLQGWSGPWAGLVRGSLDAFERTNLRPDGLYRTKVAPDGTVLDDTPWLYDQAFALFAFAGAASAGIDADRMTDRARRLIAALEALRHPAGGWREAGDHPFQSNAHMHLLEACLAWEALDADGPWTALADEIVGLARRAFIDPGGGFLREFFSVDWTPAVGEDGRLVEPGHQFEWAWLLTRWSRLRGDRALMVDVRRLYETGNRGVDARAHVAMDALNDDLSLRSRQARLWPQTERLKAALILAEEEPAGQGRTALLDDAADALAGLTRYLEPSGLYRDKLQPDGSFTPEPSPASSLYHIMVACEQLRATLARPDFVA